MKPLYAIGVVLVAGSVIVPAGAFLGDRVLGLDVLIVTPKPAETVALDREMWEPGDPVADIYGIPSERPARVLFVDESRLVRPREDPSLVLLPVDKQAGQNPLQVKTVYFVAWRAAAISLALGLLFLAAGYAASRRRARAGRL